MLYVLPRTLLLDRKFRVNACGSKTLVHCRLHMNEGLTDCSAFFVDSEGEEDDEQDDEQDNEPRDRVEVAEARDVFGESDEEGDQEPEQDQEVEERQTPEESLQGSPEVRTVS
jgi:hypothetical protein